MSERIWYKSGDHRVNPQLLKPTLPNNSRIIWNRRNQFRNKAHVETSYRWKAFDKRHWLSMDHGSYNYCIFLFPVINSKASLTWLKTKHYNSILEEDSGASPSSFRSLKHLLTVGNFNSDIIEHSWSLTSQSELLHWNLSLIWDLTQHSFLKLI